MGKKILAVSVTGFRDEDHPALWAQEGNRIIKLADFLGDDEEEIFMEIMESEYQGHKEEKWT